MSNSYGLEIYIVDIFNKKKKTLSLVSLQTVDKVPKFLKSAHHIAFVELTIECILFQNCIHVPSGVTCEILGQFVNEDSFSHSFSCPYLGHSLCLLSCGKRRWSVSIKNDFYTNKYNALIILNFDYKHRNTSER